MAWLQTSSVCSLGPVGWLCWAPSSGAELGSALVPVAVFPSLSTRAGLLALSGANRYGQFAWVALAVLGAQTPTLSRPSAGAGAGGELL